MTYWQNFYHDATAEELDDRIGWAARIAKDHPCEAPLQTFETKRMCLPTPVAVHCPNCSTEHETHDDNAYCSFCSERFRRLGGFDFIHRETGELRLT